MFSSIVASLCQMLVLCALKMKRLQLTFSFIVLLLQRFGTCSWGRFGYLGSLPKIWSLFFFLRASRTLLGKKRFYGVWCVQLFVERFGWNAIKEFLRDLVIRHTSSILWRRIWLVLGVCVVAIFETTLWLALNRAGVELY